MKKVRTIGNCLRKVKGYGLLGIGAVSSAVSAATPAFAALDLTGVSVDTADYTTIATFLITALVGFWGIKKGLGLLGR
jgi:hypothetical protein